MKANRLTTVMIVLMLMSIAISLFSIYMIYQNKEELLNSVQKNVRSELANYKIPTAEDIKLDEAQILLAVAKYCETRNDCAGKTGQPGLFGPQGQQGIQGVAGLQGIAGRDGYTPQKNVDYFDGQDGQDGQPGRSIEQRCNPDKDRVEWRYEGDENWSPLYNLGPLQTCAGDE